MLNHDVETDAAARQEAEAAERERWRCKCPKPGCDGQCPHEGEDQFSLGIPAGRWCEGCWAHSGYRKEGSEGFDETYAGERYDED